MPTNYKAYENEDGTVEFIKEGSVADVIRQDGSAVPPEVPALGTTVEDDGTTAPVLAKVSFARSTNLGSENVNLDEPTPVGFEREFDFSSKDSNFEASEKGIVANFRGVVKATLLLNFWTEGANPQRAAPIVKVTVDGEPQKMSGRESYLRSASGHNNSSSTVVDVVAVSPGQVIGGHTVRGAVAGTVNLSGAEGSILVERLI